jgi:ABC-2 type transport system ATP-binding protein
MGRRVPDLFNLYRGVSPPRLHALSTIARHDADMNTTGPMISVDHLTKRYKKSTVPAVDDISFDVRPGELFAFLGPNGAGKTTTISILTTTLAKTSGTVTIAGYDLDREAKDVRRNIGIIFQNPSVDQHLSGEENIRLHVAIYGLYGYRPMYRLMPAEYRQRVEHLAGIVGLGDAMGVPLKTFSGGMKRKLEIVRSLMHKPRVLFLDEPTSGLDPVSRRGLWTYLREVRASDATTIFLTTHYLEEAEEADRVCVIDHGRSAVIGTPTEMKRQLLERAVVLDAGDRAALTTELRGLGLTPTVGPDGLFRVTYDGLTAQELIARIHTPLSVLRIHEPSLEEAYVELLREPEEAVA